MPLSLDLIINALFFFYSFDQFNKPGCINPDVQRQTMEALLASSNPAVENCMRPEFIRLAPPLHIAEDEVFKNTYKSVGASAQLFIRK